MDWDPSKNEKLKRERGVSFEQLLLSKFVGIEVNAARRNQVNLLFEYENHVWVIPCAVTRDAVFLKTLYPSRKFTKRWERGEFH